MADFLIDINEFSQGLQLLENSTDAPVGSARKMENVLITDRGGISPRPGTSTLGTWNSNPNGTVGFYNFIKSGIETEILISSYNGNIQYYHPTLLQWYTLATGYTLGAEFTFREFVNQGDFENQIYGCNAQDSYSRWRGILDSVQIPLVGSETTLTIGTTLKPTIFAAGTCTTYTYSGVGNSNWGGSSWTTIQDSGSPSWMTNYFFQWQVTITSGPNIGLTYGIASNTSNVLTTGGDGSNPGSNFTYTITFDTTTKMVDLGLTPPTTTGPGWTTNQWDASANGGIYYFLHITSGTYKGKMIQINTNTNNILVFGNPGFNPGTGYTYEIRQSLYFSSTSGASGTLVVGNNQISYTAIPSDNSFTISAPGFAIAAGTPVTTAIESFSGVPKGNRLEVYKGKMLIGNVTEEHQVSLTSTPQNTSGLTVYASKPFNATDFTISNSLPTGHTLICPYGGGNIVDICAQENQFYIFKKYYIEADSYDDNTDLVTTTPLKQQFGAQNRVVKGRDDIYFVTTDNQITSIGRVALKDTIPQTVNMGLIIKRLIDNYAFDKFDGIEFKQRILFAGKSKSGATLNDKVIVYNKQNKAFEGVWDLSVFGFEILNDGLYYADASTPNIQQMFSGYNDVRNGKNLPISVSWRSNWIHLVPRRSRFRVKPSQFMLQGINTMGFVGYIRDGSQLTFSLFTDMSDQPVKQFTFGILDTDEAYMAPAPLERFLGDNPLGLSPIGDITTPDLNGFRHFKFVTYFPDVYSNWLSLGVDSNGLDTAYEITRIGIGTAEDAMQAADNILNT